MVTAVDLWQRWDGFVADKVFTAFETLFNGGMGHLSVQTELVEKALPAAPS